MVDEVVKALNFSTIAQALIVAAITAVATGYVSAKVLEQQVGFLLQEIRRVDEAGKELRAKVEVISLKQASVISQADTIHVTTDKRLDKLENRK